MKEVLGPELIIRLIVAVAMGILFGLVVLLIPDFINASLIQVIGLIIALVFSNKKQIPAKGILKVFVSVSLVYSILSNCFIWILNPPSEVTESLELITFLFFNNSIFLLGVAISLFVYVFKFRTT